VPTFFIPGIDEDRRGAERAYVEMRDALELELGNPPHTRRITSLWARRGSTDCITEVGAPDPLLGGVVLAIFDMGHQRPYVVWWRPHDGAPTGVREILGPHAYSVVEFDS
jgi:hypothetical protein